AAAPARLLGGAGAHPPPPTPLARSRPALPPPRAPTRSGRAQETCSTDRTSLQLHLINDPPGFNCGCSVRDTSHRGHVATSVEWLDVPPHHPRRRRRLRER